MSDDRSCIIWKLENGKYEEITRYEDLHSSSIYSVSWGSKYIATAGGDDMINLLELNGNGLTLKDSFKAHDGDVNCVAWCSVAAHDDLLASCGDDNKVKVWKL